jgi:hypothetical protein
MVKVLILLKYDDSDDFFVEYSWKMPAAHALKLQGKISKTDDMLCVILEEEMEFEVMDLRAACEILEL